MNHSGQNVCPVFVRVVIGLTGFQKNLPDVELILMFLSFQSCKNAFSRTKELCGLFYTVIFKSFKIKGRILEVNNGTLESKVFVFSSVRVYHVGMSWLINEHRASGKKYED